MGLFGDIDFGNVPDDPFAIPDNSYLAYLTEVKTGPTKAGDKIGLTLVYTIAEGEFEGRKVQEWKQIVQPADPAHPTAEEARSLSYLKARMLDLGVRPDRLQSVIPDDLVGIKVVLALQTKGQYQNVVRCKAVDEDFALEGERV
jgi:hypothetical protein